MRAGFQRGPHARLHGRIPQAGPLLHASARRVARRYKLPPLLPMACASMHRHLRGRLHEIAMRGPFLPTLLGSLRYWYFIMKTPPNDANAVMRRLLRTVSLVRFVLPSYSARRSVEQGPRLRGCDRAGAHEDRAELRRALSRSGVASIGQGRWRVRGRKRGPFRGSDPGDARRSSYHAPRSAPRSHPHRWARCRAEQVPSRCVRWMRPRKRARACTTRHVRLHGRIPASGAPAPRCAGPCSALRCSLLRPARYARGRFAVILGRPVAANSDNYWLRRSSPNCLTNRLAIIASP